MYTPMLNLGEWNWKSVQIGGVCLIHLFYPSLILGVPMTSNFLFLSVNAFSEW